MATHHVKLYSHIYIDPDHFYRLNRIFYMLLGADARNNDSVAFVKGKNKYPTHIDHPAIFERKMWHRRNSNIFCVHDAWPLRAGQALLPASPGACISEIHPLLCCTSCSMQDNSSRTFSMHIRLQGSSHDRLTDGFRCATCTCCFQFKPGGVLFTRSCTLRQRGTCAS